MEAMRRKYGAADYRNAQGVMRAVHVKSVNETYEAQLVATKCPVELVWGEDDTAAPVSVAHAAAAMLETASVTILPGVGHMVPLAAPEALTAALQRTQPSRP
jgi:pimeloyl-ACP methyl ester carboxylesterase